jgi:hypothetical protein
MVLEQNRLYRLAARGGPGLACDAEGVTLAGVTLALVSVGANGERRCRVRPGDQLKQILRLAYGEQSAAVAQRCERGLHRVAHCLEAGEVARAGLEALMLRFPAVDWSGLRSRKLGSESLAAAR